MVRAARQVLSNRSAAWTRSLERMSHGQRDRTCFRGAARAAVREDRAPRRVVGAAAARVPRPLDVSGLCDVGGVSGRSLHVRPVPLAVLLAGDSRVVTSQLVRPEARGVAGVAAVLAGPLHPADPGVLPAHVLLLPRRLL